MRLLFEEGFGASVLLLGEGFGASGLLLKKVFFSLRLFIEEVDAVVENLLASAIIELVVGL